MSSPRVSIITPTYERRQFLSLALLCYRHQSFSEIEWIILDDSAVPNIEFEQISDQKIRYAWSSRRMTVGAKRNWLVNEARGNIIVHFDDDDYYAPTYVESRLNDLEASSGDLSLLSGFTVCHLDNKEFGYYETRKKSGSARRFSRTGIHSVELDQLNIPFIEHCFGFSYIYKKTLWEKSQFPEQDIFEDREFVLAHNPNGRINYQDDKEHLVIHAVHARSGSTCFPQHVIPPSLLLDRRPEFLTYLRGAKDNKF